MSISDQGKYLLFSAQQEAVDANLKIFENLGHSKSTVVRSLTEEEVDPTTIPDGELVAMVYTIPGYINGTIQTDEGQTTAWADIHECVNSAGYVIPKPIDSLMTGVVYDSIEDRNEEWYTDETI